MTLFHIIALAFNVGLLVGCVATFLFLCRPPSRGHSPSVTPNSDRKMPPGWCPNPGGTGASASTKSEERPSD